MAGKSAGGRKLNSFQVEAVKVTRPANFSLVTAYLRRMGK